MFIERSTERRLGAYEIRYTFRDADSESLAFRSCNDYNLPIYDHTNHLLQSCKTSYFDSVFVKKIVVQEDYNKT